MKKLIIFITLLQLGNVAILYGGRYSERRKKYHQRYPHQVSEENASVQNTALLQEREARIENLTEKTALTKAEAKAYAQECRKLRKKMERQNQCCGCLIL